MYKHCFLSQFCTCFADSPDSKPKIWGLYHDVTEDAKMNLVAVQIPLLTHGIDPSRITP